MCNRANTMIIFLVAVFLAGCMTPEERQTQQEERLLQIAESEDAECTSYGLKFGSPEYGDCRVQLASIRARKQAMAFGVWTQKMQAQQRRLTESQMQGRFQSLKLGIVPPLSVPSNCWIYPLGSMYHVSCN